jgi:hypothetical protein
MNTPANTQRVSIPDTARIAFAGFRYDFWLDLRSVPRRRRRELRSELRSNLADAALHVGVGPALSNLGSLRRLAAETTEDGQLRSRWTAGWTAAVTTLAVLLFAFLVLTLYWAEGALDAGATEPVRSSLFPFLGSTIEVDPSNDGLAWSMEPGPAPLVSAFIVWLLVAKPWRSLTRQTATNQQSS